MNYVTDPDPEFQGYLYSAILKHPLRVTIHQEKSRMTGGHIAWTFGIGWNDMNERQNVFQRYSHSMCRVSDPTAFPSLSALPHSPCLTPQHPTERKIT